MGATAHGLPGPTEARAENLAHYRIPSAGLFLRLRHRTMNCMNMVVFLLALGITCRITRFITKDTLAAGFRSWMAERFGDDSQFAYVVTCSWCTSIWVSAAVVPVAFLAGSSVAFQAVAMVLTLSYLSGVASNWLD